MSSPIKASIRNIRTVTVLFGVGLLCFVWVGLFFIVQSERKTESDSALKETANYARMFEEHTIRTIKGLDQIVLLLKYQVEKEGTVDIPRLVKEKRFEGQPFVQLGVTDEKGELKATSIVPFVNTTLGDREHFLVHKDSDTGKLFISKPVVGRVSGKWAIQLSRRINKADGSFGGIAVASVDPYYFAEFYRQINLGEGSSIALIGQDTIVRVRQSDTEVVIGQDFSNSVVMKKAPVSDVGNFVAPSPVDGINRIYSYRALREYPLIVVAGVSEKQTFHNLNQRVIVYSLACGAMSVVIVLFIVISLSGAAQRRSAKLQAVLREIAEAALRATSLHEFYLSVHQSVSKILPARFFIINLLDEASGDIVVPFQSAAVNFIPQRRPSGNGMTEYIMRLGRTVHATAADLERLRQTGEYTLEQTQHVKVAEYLGAPLKDSQGKPFGMMSVVLLDATETFQPGDAEIFSIIAAQVSLGIERRRAEEAVQAGKFRYHALVDQSFEALVLLDIQTQEVVEVNRRFTEILGYSLPEDSPLHNHQVVVDTPQNIERYFNETLRQQKNLPLETRLFRHKNGTQVYAERAGTVIQLEGREYLLVSMRDMSAERRRQSELSRDVEFTRRVQRELLPKLKESPLVTIRTIYHPSNFVSGDFYQIDWCNEGKLLRGFLIDVSGHGLATAIQTSAVTVLLREDTASPRSLQDLVRWANARLMPYFTEGAYAAIIGFEVDFSRRELRYVGAGITQFFANGKKIETPGMFVGLWKDPEFNGGVIDIAEGDCFCFLTDGFTDALAKPENESLFSQDGKALDAHVAALEQLAESGILRDDATGVFLKIKKLL